MAAAGFGIVFTAVWLMAVFREKLERGDHITVFNGTGACDLSFLYGTRFFYCLLCAP